MKFIRRIAFFSGGFGLGIVILLFILSGKETSCDYGIQARTLKNIRLKERSFSESSLAFFNENQLDTSEVSTMLHQGKVVFSESETQLDSCRTYVIRGKKGKFEDHKTLKVRIENCDDLATVMEAYFEE